jgi:hypothetical protein
MQAQPEECYFWSTHTGAELDLLIVRGRRRYGFEVKLTSAPEYSKSMRIAMKDLKLTRLDVIHAGEKSFPLSSNARALAVTDIAEQLKKL